MTLNHHEQGGQSSFSVLKIGAAAGIAGALSGIASLNAGNIRLVGLVLVALGALTLLVRRPEWCAPAAIWGIVIVGVVRRITSSDDGYTENDPIIVAPLLALLPLLVTLRPRLLRLPLVALLISLACFTAVLTVPAGLLHSSLLGCLRPLGFLLLPALACIALIAASTNQLLQHVLPSIRWSALASAAYGYLQFFNPPSWDLDWLKARTVAGGTFGSPEAGDFRLFGTTSSPLAFASILCCGIICWYFYSSNPIVRIAAISILLIPLLLTSVRTSVFALVTTLIILLLANLGAKSISFAALLSFVLVGINSIAESLNPSLANRFSLTNLGADTSLQARSNLLESALKPALLSLGSGPGSSATGSIVTDNGYLAALEEYGTVGVVLVVIIIVLVLSRGIGLRERQPSQAAAVGIVLFLALSETSAPLIQGEIGVLFWLAVASVVHREFWSDNTSPRSLKERTGVQ